MPPDSLLKSCDIVFFETRVMPPLSAFDRLVRGTEVGMRAAEKKTVVLKYSTISDTE